MTQAEALNILKTGRNAVIGADGQTQLVRVDGFTGLDSGYCYMDWLLGRADLEALTIVVEDPDEEIFDQCIDRP